MWRNELSSHLCALEEEVELVTFGISHSISEQRQKDDADKYLHSPQNYKRNAEEGLLDSDTYVHQDTGQRNHSHCSGKIDHKRVFYPIVIHECIEENYNDGQSAVDE